MSTAPRVLRASHTHLYPGALLGAADALPHAGQRLLIEFADLGSAATRVEAADGAQLTLAVNSHRTARGTAVSAKRWLVDAETQDCWRVRRRLPADG